MLLTIEAGLLALWSVCHVLFCFVVDIISALSFSLWDAAVQCVSCCDVLMSFAMYRLVV